MMKRISKSTTENIRDYLNKVGRTTDFKRVMSDMSQLETQISRTTFFHEEEEIS